MMDIDISVAFPCSARVGEGPFWDRRTGLLHWVDILAGRIHTGDTRTGSRLEPVTLPTLVGAAVPKTSGGFVAATKEGFADVDPGGTSTTRSAFLPAGHRMNDAKCDASGRLWAGSTDMDFAPGQGALHVLSPDWSSLHVLDGLTLPNGLGWSPDQRTFYLVDTIAGELNAFDVTPGRSTLANRRLLTRFNESSGMPDGMTIDTDGCLWIAMWGGDRLLRISPEGRTLMELPVPARQPSSCTFGGPDLDVLYVTTAREGLDLEEEDPAGSVLAVRGLGARGLPATRFGG
ncbi:SMP-30/gluconolactonase/LRE family protein [Actinoallomurus sp. NPDC050550]|uniref:SMP-30/gluconolactonase/LRE family protein n=1 Tax=Actinoallomurus sp. NPDC050550 TaxID=3154937 RepID=UPI0033FA4652